MWRLYQRALPVDDNIQAKGVVLSSKCVCCGSPHQESMNHLLVESDLAHEVWGHFGAKLQKYYSYNTISQLVNGWLHGVSRRSQLGYSTIGIVFYGLWEIWKERCTAKYEDGKISTHRVFHAIYEHIYNLNMMHTPKRRPTNWETNKLEMIGVPVKGVAFKKGRWVCWEKPNPGMIKVNTDGSKKHTNTSGGGVIRCHSGFFLFGFGTKLLMQDILRA